MGDYPAELGRGSTTQKPERLLEAVFAVHRGLVLDFCAGSCTTAVAAVRRGEAGVGADLDDDDEEPPRRTST